MKRLTGCFLTALLALCLGAGPCAADSAGQKSTETRNPPLAHIVYDGEMVPLLARLAQEFGVNIGVEIYPWQPRIPVRVELKDPTLHDILDAVTRSAPGYAWREVDGAVEVSPVRGGNALLDAPVGGLRVNDADQAEAVELLMNLPEVRAALGTSGLQYRSAGGATAKRGGKRFSINLEGGTLRRALHEIAEKGGGRFWVFRTYGNERDGRHVTIGTSDGW